MGVLPMPTEGLERRRRLRLSSSMRGATDRPPRAIEGALSVSAGSPVTTTREQMLPPLPSGLRNTTGVPVSG